MSYSFEQLCEFKKGETYWENSQYGCIQFTVKEDATLSVGEDRVEFIGVTDNEKEIKYMMCKDYPHYGPRISDHKLYFTMKEFEEQVNE